MREWQLTADSPLSLRLAADARFGRTDYFDDQAWEIAFGGPEEPAIALQTRFGGRVGLARIVPMWLFDGRAVYQTIGYAERPAVRAFAPNYARITARPINALHLNTEIWVMDSHSIGGQFTLENKSDQGISLRCELIAQVVRDQKSPEMNLLGLDDGSEALHLGRIGNLNPVMLLEKSATPPPAGRERASAKLTAPLIVPARGSITVRWVHTGLPSLNDSLNVAYRWLQRTDWNTELAQIKSANARTPDFETGNADLDLALAYSANLVLRSFVGPTGNMPHASFVTARTPSRGFSAYGDGSDHGYQWSGQSALVGYLALPAAAMLAPDLAMGAFRNWMAAMQPDGWIDFKPGLGGQRARMLSMPLLASIAWKIYEATENKAFIEEVQPGLRTFFLRWFQADCDRDGDGFPEWHNVSQSGYSENPTFARFRRWAKNADINKAEAPDLAAYLIAEGHSLLRMVELTGSADDAEVIKSRVEKLTTMLDSLWQAESATYLYRDRDSDQSIPGVHLFRGKGDEAFDVKTPISPANRLLLRVVGGKESAPRVSAVIEGIDARGKHVSETLNTSAFAWYYGLGAAVTERVYAQVNYIKFEGLIRLYNVEIDTVDLTGQNLMQLLPLWAGAAKPDRAKQIVATLTDSARYWREFGLPVCPASDPAFAPNNDGGSGGVWLFWNALLMEGLLTNGFASEATTLFNRIAAAQIKALRRDRAFREGYNSETGDGLGDIDDLIGAIPLGLFMHMIGVQVINDRRLRAGGPFTFANPIKVSMLGIEITRSAKGTRVRFPSGHSAEVGAEWQLIEDPTPIPASPVVTVPPIPAAPKPSAPVVVEPGSLPEESAFGGAGDQGDKIPVDQKKDDTMEIPISKLNLRKDRPTPPSTEPPPPQPPPSTPPSGPSTPPGTIKIPVRGPNSGKQ